MFEKLKTMIAKIKDYDRLENDYACVLCHATHDRMSKTNYALSEIYSVIDDVQQEYFADFVYDDIKDETDIEVIKKYIFDMTSDKHER